MSIHAAAMVHALGEPDCSRPCAASGVNVPETSTEGEGRRPALMQLTGQLPFGQAWKDAVARVHPVRGVDAPGHPGSDLAVEPIRLPAGRLTWRVEARLRGQRLARAVRRAGLRPRLLHSHFYSMSAGVPRAADDLGLPLVVTEHSTWLAGDHPDPRKRITGPGRRLARSVYDRAARVVAVSSYLAERIVALGVPADRVVVIGNPVDTEWFRPQPRHEGGDTIDIVSTGRLAVEKGLDTLLRALALLPGTLAPRLHLIGDGPSRVDLERLASDLGVRDVVTFHGRQPAGRVRELLAAADLYCSPSRIETFGVAVVEALASGLPTVTSDRTALRELGDAPGLTQTSSEDPRELADALLAAIEERRSHDPWAAWRWVEARFSPRVIATQVASVYDEVS